MDLIEQARNDPIGVISKNSELRVIELLVMLTTFIVTLEIPF